MAGPLRLANLGGGKLTDGTGRLARSSKGGWACVLVDTLACVSLQSDFMDRAQLHIKKIAEALTEEKINTSLRIAGQEANLCMEVWAYLSKRGTRQAARDLGFSAAYLSDVSRCKRNVSAELLNRVLSL